MLAEEYDLNRLSLTNNCCLQTEVLQIQALNKHEQHLAAMRERRLAMENELTNSDIIRIKKDIEISLVVSSLVFFGLVIIAGIILGLLFLFGKPSDGFITRGLLVIGLLLLPFLVICWKNLLKYIDIKKGKKLQFKSGDYKIVKKKDAAIIVTRDVRNKKFEVYNDLLPLIEPDKPIIIEISPLSKTLLFLSHDSKNLLDISEA